MVRSFHHKSLEDGPVEYLDPQNIKDRSRWVVTLIRGLYKPHIGPLPLYEPYMSHLWGYPPGNYPPETVPENTVAAKIPGGPHLTGA